jgi:hypothetical protein
VGGCGWVLFVGLMALRSLKTKTKNLFHFESQNVKRLLCLISDKKIPHAAIAAWGIFPVITP